MILLMLDTTISAVRYERATEENTATHIHMSDVVIKISEHLFHGR